MATIKELLEKNEALQAEIRQLKKQVELVCEEFKKAYQELPPDSQYKFGVECKLNALKDWELQDWAEKESKK